MLCIFSNQWVKDYNPGTSGDPVYYEHYADGKIFLKILDTGEPIVTDEYYASGNKKIETFFDADAVGWYWKKTIQYYDADPSVPYQEWLKDPNPEAFGSVVFREYDTEGMWVYQIYDDGNTEYNPGLGSLSEPMREETIVNTADTEALSRLELESQHNQSTATGNVTFTSEISDGPADKDLLIGL